MYVIAIIYIWIWLGTLLTLWILTNKTDMKPRKKFVAVFKLFFWPYYLYKFMRTI